MIKRFLIGIACLLLPSFASANCVVGATGVVGTGTCGKAGMTLIATQTASGTPALQFSGVNWSSSYPRLVLECEGLLQSATNYLLVQVGEGGGPTWQSGGSYVTTGMGANSNAGQMGPWGRTVATDLLGGWAGSATIPASLTLSIDNVSSTTIKKKVMFQFSIWPDGLNYEIGASGSGFWNGDNAAITGLQVITSGGNTTAGSCSLYGVLQ